VPLTIAERILSGLSALFLMFAGWRTDLIGLALLALLLASTYWRYTRQRDRAAAPGQSAGGGAVPSAFPAAHPRD
jgi:membrane protein implicated in regulation of membrane protease activity